MTLYQEPLVSGSFVLNLAHSTIEARTPAPRIVGQADVSPTWERSETRKGQIAHLTGQVDIDRADYGRWTLRREIFRNDDVVGIRLAITNTSDQPFCLSCMVPLRIEGADSLQIPAGPLADWRVVRGGRQKNDVPGNFRFTDDDIDLEHACIDAAEFKAGSGVKAEDLAGLDQPRTTISADPYLWIRNRHDASPAFFVGVVGQTEHLTTIRLECNADRDQFLALSAVCEMDDVVLAPGESRITHWIVLREGSDEETLRQDHADLVGRLMNVPPPAQPPISYFCSWYFYGTDFTQADLDENLAGLRARPIPFDVFVIDNGWMTDFGDYRPNSRFPQGMRHAADCIRAAGYVPGIWTSPFVVMRHSPALHKYPRLIARDASGAPVLFPYETSKEYVVDPTSPDAEAYFTELFDKLRSWGFVVHKFDFLRAITSNPRIRFCDRSMNRAQAYRHGMTMIRRLVGDDNYILACGGLFEASAGLVDGMRVGSDTKGRWNDTNAATAYHRMGYVVRIKQNIFRNHTNRLWHTDPDALQLRRREGAFRDKAEFVHLCQGIFTDDEALTIVAHHYLGGGIVCLCERMQELPDDRLDLLPRALPAVTPPARIVDFDQAECPTTFYTTVTPGWAPDQPWATLTLCNWADRPVVRTVRPDCVPWMADRPMLTVMELVTQSFMGVCAADEPMQVTIPPHGTRVLRIAPWNGVSPILLGTDGHLSGGGAEFESMDLRDNRIAVKIGWKWHRPLVITVGLPHDRRLQPVLISVPGDRRVFEAALQFGDGVAAAASSTASTPAPSITAAT